MKVINRISNWIRKEFSKKQMSEAFLNSAFLALSGGFQDAYTYNSRDEVFSNAQTGNVVLMSQYFMQREWTNGLRYLLPLVAFGAGVFVAEMVRNRFKNARKLHWRQGIVLIEISILFLVGFIPAELNRIATILVSFSCAMQVQTFRKVNGYSYASTMCIGNLRSATASLALYIRERNGLQLKQACYYFGIILFFAVGAGIGGVLSITYGIHVIWISCIFLLFSFLFMFLERLK